VLLPGRLRRDCEHTSAYGRVPWERSLSTTRQLHPASQLTRAVDAQVRCPPNGHHGRSVAEATRQRLRRLPRRPRTSVIPPPTGTKMG
jgi:hypothetical protein